MAVHVSSVSFRCFVFSISSLGAREPRGRSGGPGLAHLISPTHGRSPRGKTLQFCGEIPAEDLPGDSLHPPGTRRCNPSSSASIGTRRSSSTDRAGIWQSPVQGLGARRDAVCQLHARRLAATGSLAPRPAVGVGVRWLAMGALNTTAQPGRWTGWKGPEGEGHAVALADTGGRFAGWTDRRTHALAEKEDDESENNPIADGRRRGLQG